MHISRRINVNKGGIPLNVFSATCRKYFSIKMIFYQVNYTFCGKPLYFPETCLKYNNFIGGIPLQLDRIWFQNYNISGKLPENLVVGYSLKKKTYRCK